MFVFSLLIIVGAFMVVTFAIIIPLIEKTTTDLSDGIDKAIESATAQQVARDIQNKMVAKIIEGDLIKMRNAQNTSSMTMNTGGISVNTTSMNTSASTTTTTSTSMNTSAETQTTNASTVSVNTAAASYDPSNVSDMLSTLTSAIGGTNCAQGQYYANGMCVTPVQNAKTNPVLVQNLQNIVHDLITLVANTQ